MIYKNHTLAQSPFFVREPVRTPEMRVCARRRDPPSAALTLRCGERRGVQFGEDLETDDEAA
jgi:hypothetical protein